MRVKSALGQVGPCQLGAVGLIYRPDPVLPTFFIRDASMRYVQQKVEGIMFGSKLYCWSVNLVSLSGSDFITVREAAKKYIFA